MDLFEQTRIQEKMAGLANKWKDKVPEKFSTEWWRYRGDQSLYVWLKAKLAKLKKKAI
jgi:hypothetical protein